MRKWQGTVIPGLLIEKVLHGGCVVFASAAALTLGLVTVPVYEIYKCGEDPHWLDGLDVASAAGIKAAVIPHYDNNEGGTHDTRFCYLGERRLSMMERQLPSGAFVLGVDEHTACVLDVDAGTASVEGRGSVTVRSAGRSATFASGETVSISQILETAESLARSSHGAKGVDSPVTPAGLRRRSRPPVRCRSAHLLWWTSSGRRRPTSRPQSPHATWPLAVNTVLSLEHDITEWSTDIPGGDELDRAHASLRSLIFELGRLSQTGTRDPRDVLGPSSRLSWKLRNAARRDGRFVEADHVRERLARVRDRESATHRKGVNGSSSATAMQGRWPLTDIFRVRPRRLSPSGRAPIVQRPRTSPFQGGNTGSNPVGGASHLTS